MFERTIMFTDRLHTSPRPHGVVTQTSGVVSPTHRTLGTRGGTQTAWWKQKLNKMRPKLETSESQRNAQKEALRPSNSIMQVQATHSVDRIYK